CPAVRAASATPGAVRRGQSVRVRVTATAADEGAPDAGGLTYAWTAPDGVFSDASAPETSYQCASDGAKTLEVTVSDDLTGCVRRATVEVQCGPDLCADAETRCDDGSACTSDGCDRRTGACLHVANDAVCDDGIACTVDRCDARTGSCTSQPNDAGCEDHEECTADACGDGGCEHAAVPDGIACGGGAGTCEGGRCAVGPTGEGQGAIRLDLVAGAGSVVDTFRYTISGGGFHEIVGTLPRAGASTTPIWARLSGIPAGVDRVVTVTGLDEGGAAVCEMRATVDVVAGETAKVSLAGSCGEQARPAAGALRVNAAFGDRSIETVRYRVRGADFADIVGTTPAIRGGAVPLWLLVTNVPAGTDRSVTVTGVDAEGNTVCEGSASVDVRAGRTAEVTPALACDGELGSATGALRLDVSVGGSGIDAIEYVVSGAGFSDVVGTLPVIPGGTPPIWALITAIPAGIDRTVTLTALDADGGTVCHVQADVSIPAGDTAELRLQLACDGAVRGDDGALRLSLTVAGGAVETARYTISGEGFDDIEGTLPIVDRPTLPVWALLTGIPAGPARTLTVTGLDGGGHAACSGSSTFDLAAGQTVKVALGLSCGAP
ncbi:MAG: hypothetical protein KC543_08115, partial [Myxococcales bacterium]|nr:hypothetical protein [Myxococcales bacterium]